MAHGLKIEDFLSSRFQRIKRVRSCWRPAGSTTTCAGAMSSRDTPIERCPSSILAGGMGTRLREETEHVPKPMVEIGEHPILWHIMKLYGHHGARRFILCLGYKGWQIKQYFLRYHEQGATSPSHRQRRRRRPSTTARSRRTGRSRSPRPAWRPAPAAA